jgi:hypothetical protein
MTVIEVGVMTDLKVTFQLCWMLSIVGVYFITKYVFVSMLYCSLLMNVYNYH